MSALWTAKLADNCVIHFPKCWGFVGSVGRAFSHDENGKTRYWETRDEAIAAAHALGLSVREGTNTIYPVKVSLKAVSP